MSTTCPEARPSAARAAQTLRQAGFTLVSVVFILVVLAVLGTALARISTRQQLGSATDLAAARAYQAAYAGLEWASFQVLRNGSTPACFGSTSFKAAALPDFTITVSCARTPGSGTVTDGANAMAFYQVVANACNAPTGGTCPNGATTQPTYVERQLSRMVVMP